MCKNIFETNCLLIKNTNLKIIKKMLIFSEGFHFLLESSDKKIFLSDSNQINIYSKKKNIYLLTKIIMGNSIEINEFIPNILFILIAPKESYSETFIFQYSLGNLELMKFKKLCYKVSYWTKFNNDKLLIFSYSISEVELEELIDIHTLKRLNNFSNFSLYVNLIKGINDKLLFIWHYTSGIYEIKFFHNNNAIIKKLLDYSKDEKKLYRIIENKDNKIIVLIYNNNNDGYNYILFYKNLL